MKNFLQSLPPIPDSLDWLLFTILILTTFIGISKILWKRLDLLKKNWKTSSNSRDNKSFAFSCFILYFLYVCHYRPSFLMLLGLRSLVRGLIGVIYLISLAFVGAWFYSSQNFLLSSIYTVICLFILVDSMAHLRHIWQLLNKHFLYSKNINFIFKNMEEYIAGRNKSKKVKDAKKIRQRLVIAIKRRAKRDFPFLNNNEPEPDRIF